MDESSSLVRVALTGGIATGKSYCLARFAAEGAPTIDADELARHAVAPGTSGLSRVVSRFGTSILKSDGSLNREALGSLVFADADARRALEAIVHPVVYNAIERWFDGVAHAGHSTAAIADIPLLFETGREGDFDTVIVAACSPEIQRARLIARSGLAAGEADRRIASQLPVRAKRDRADFVIDTSGTTADTDRQVREIWTTISGGGFRRR